MEKQNPYQEFWKASFHTFRELEQYARHFPLKDNGRVQEVHDTEQTF